MITQRKQVHLCLILFSSLDNNNLECTAWKVIKKTLRSLKVEQKNMSYIDSRQLSATTADVFEEASILH